MKILFTGGGTGGHIFPIIAVCREIKKIYPGNDLSLFYLGPCDELSKILLTQEGIEVKCILAGKIRRYLNFQSIFQNLFDLLFKVPIGIFQAFFHIFFLAPDLIFSKGGYGSLPVVLSGWILQTPIFLHESDIVPGLVNRFLSRLSLEVFVSFPVQKTEYFSLKKMISVGNPIRKEILWGKKEIAKGLFKLTGEKPIILILGGSQGAQRINDLLMAILPEILTQCEIIHQCGEKNFNQVQAEVKVIVPKNLERYYHLLPFLKEDELREAYGAADLVVSRAGSGTIFEIAACQKPSILIPLPESAQNHQVKNAYAYAETKASLVIEEANLSPHFFLERVKDLLYRPAELVKMKKAAGEFSRPRAAEIIAKYLIEYLSQ